LRKHAHTLRENSSNTNQAQKDYATLWKMHAGARPSEMSVMMSKNINICGKLRVNIGQYVPKYRAKEAKLSGWMRGTWIKEVNARVYAAEGADAADSGSENSKMNIGTGANNPSAPQGFTTLEKTIQDTLGGEGQGGWKEVEGCWVLYPDKLKDDTAGERAPRCLIHFVGGAYVGAAPQLAYRPLLEALAERGALVVATPFATGFDHLRTVDEVYFKFSRCLKALGPKAQMLPSYGLGHSLGSLMQLLVCSRYVVPRSGNILMSAFFHFHQFRYSDNDAGIYLMTDYSLFFSYVCRL